jgi:hypothetical protein
VTGKRKPLICPHCRKPISASTVASYQAKLYGAGRKPALTPCEFCGDQFGTVSMRLHIPRCPKNPGATKKPKRAKLKKAA